MSAPLSDAERERFASWLESQAEQGEATAKQIEALDTPISQRLASRERAEALAAKVIAHKLRSYESMTI